jgi:serine/threonine-protein kinase
MLLGTPEYMAPEQIRGGTVDARVDLYAAGALMYHALCGRPPFTGDNPIAISLAHVNDPVPPPSQWRAELAGPWEEWLGLALAKDPQARFPDAERMRAALPA